MKKFSFSLDRVLAWRQTQAHLEEATLSRLTDELLKLRGRMAVLDKAVSDARAGLLGAKSVFPIEIGALDHFRASTSAQTQHLYREVQVLQGKIAQQTQAVIRRRREAQLLERLRQKRLETWHQAANREIEQQAEESYLARFTRSSHT